MTQAQIQRQIEVIHEATAEALKSPESTRQFLIEVGLIKDKPQKKNNQKNKK
jgi:hypothetical protein